MNISYFCPSCKQEVKNSERKLICEECNRIYEFKMGIPMLLTSDIQYAHGDSDYGDWVDLVSSANGYAFDSSSTIKYVDFMNCLKQKYIRVLDLGCGGGASSSVIEPISETIYGVDLSHKALLVFKERKIKNSIPIMASVYHLPFPDDYFDLVVSIAVVEHLKDPLTMIDEIKRVLKDGGHFLIRNDALMHGILERLRLLPGRLGSRPDPTHINMMTPRRLRRILVDHSFIILKKWYLPLSKFSSILNADILSVFAMKGQFLCTIYKF